jgi:hypothetical protein
MQSTVWGNSHMLPSRGVRVWVVYLTPKIERVISLLSASPVGEARCRCRKVWLTRIDYYYYRSHMVRCAVLLHYSIVLHLTGDMMVRLCIFSVLPRHMNMRRCVPEKHITVSYSESHQGPLCLASRTVLHGCVCWCVSLWILFVAALLAHQRLAGCLRCLGVQLCGQLARLLTCLRAACSLVCHVLPARGMHSICKVLHCVHSQVSWY